MGLDSRDYYRPSGMGGFSFFPPVLKKILIANVIVFVIQMFAGLVVYTYDQGYPITYDKLIIYYFALNPIGHGFKIWQLISYQFMHAGFTHILFNMFFLWMFGMEIENIMGSRKFLIFYLVSGVGAGLFQLLISPIISPGGVGATLGASGAVYGVMIAFAMFFPDRYIYLYFLIPIKAKYLIAILVIFEFMSVGDQSIVAHLAHIGGAITALILILLDRRNEFNVDKLFRKFKKPGGSRTKVNYRKPSFSIRDDDVQDAKFYDINSGSEEDEISQSNIDAILDKISKSGYQKLSEREKRILFEASKKK